MPTDRSRSRRRRISPSSSPFSKTARRCSPAWRRSTKTSSKSFGRAGWTPPTIQLRRRRASTQPIVSPTRSSTPYRCWVKADFEKATAALRAVLETYPNCSEARELLEVAYKAASGTGLPVDLGEALKRGTEAFAAGRQRGRDRVLEAVSHRRAGEQTVTAARHARDGRGPRSGASTTPTKSWRREARR